MAFTINDLRLIICEDEYLIASDLAQQLVAMGATVVAIVGSVAELEQAMRDGREANSALLDVELTDGQVYPAIPLLEERGIVVAFCTAYPARTCPPRFAHLAWIDKLALAEDIAAALCAAHDARSNAHID